MSGPNKPAWNSEPSTSDKVFRIAKSNLYNGVTLASGITFGDTHSEKSDQQINAKCSSSIVYISSRPKEYKTKVSGFIRIYDPVFTNYWISEDLPSMTR